VSIRVHLWQNLREPDQSWHIAVQRTYGVLIFVFYVVNLECRSSGSKSARIADATTNQHCQPLPGFANGRPDFTIQNSPFTIQNSQFIAALPGKSAPEN
jgi:hypothetical protein